MSFKKKYYLLVPAGLLIFYISFPDQGTPLIAAVFPSVPHSQVAGVSNAHTPFSSQNRDGMGSEGPLSGGLVNPTIQPDSNDEKQDSSLTLHVSSSAIEQKEDQSSQTTSKREDPSPDPSFRSDLFRKLPSAVVNEPYCQYLDPLWGTAPQQWVLTSGSIPEGFHFDPVNGMLCGEAKTEGFYAFQVRIHDAKNHFIHIRYELLVLAFPPSESKGGTLVILTDQLSAGFVGKDYFVQLSAAGGEPPYHWRTAFLPEGISLHAQTGVLYGVPLRPSSQSIQVFLTDQSRRQVTKSLSLVIETSPLFITTQELARAQVGNAYYHKMVAQGGTPPYRWQVISGEIPQGLYFDTSTATFQGTPLLAQTAVLQIRVSDQQEKYDIVELSLTASGSPLKIQTDFLISGMVGRPYYVSLSATGGVPPYTWSLSSGILPRGMNLQPTGILTGVPSEAKDSLLLLEVKDQFGNKERVTLNLQIQAHPLEILTDQLPEATLETLYAFRLAAQGGAPSYTWEIAEGSLPPGLHLSADGLISGQPQLEQTTDVRLRVTDALLHSVERSYTFKIIPANIFIQTNEISTATYHQEFEFPLQVVGGIPPYAWTILGGQLPGDLTLHSSGLIAGIPQETGLFPFEVQVSDSDQQAATKSMLLSVVEEPLRIVTSSLPEGKVGLDFSASLAAVGGISPYLWSILSGGLPQGLLLQGDSGNIVGIPTQAGLFEVSFEVTDTLGKSENRNYEFNIQGSPLEILSHTINDGTVNEPYGESLTAQGGLPPYVWAINAGALPDGLSLHSTGNISGTPVRTGVETVIVQVTDQESSMDHQRLTIDIQSQPLTFHTHELPEGKADVFFQFPLQVTGGTLPYHWGLTSGALPEGLQLDAQTGVISGTPTETGDQFIFTIVVTDEDAVSVQRDLLLKILSADMTPVTGLMARGSDRKIGLAWTNPASPQFDHVKIVRKLASVPQSPNDGAQIYSGQANNVVDQNLSNGTTYYYSAFAYDPLGTPSALGPTSSGQATPEAVSLSGPSDPFVDEVVVFNPLSGNYFGSPNLVLGAPQGSGEWTGSLDVVSIHAKVNHNNGATPPYGGHIVLRFNNNIVVNGPGTDFIVFENAFRMAGTDSYWIEPAVVDVSIDGVTYHRFPFDFVPHYDRDGKIDLLNPFSYARGFAGVKPVLSNHLSTNPTDPAVSGGDLFDLDDLGVPLAWFQYIKITSTGDNWLADSNGDRVRHSNQAPTWAASGSGNSGFDLDAVSAVHY